MIPAALLAVLAVTAGAAPFDRDTAAKCAGVHQVALDAMLAANADPGPDPVPQAVLRRVDHGLTMWEYELAGAVAGTIAAPTFDVLKRDAAAGFEAHLDSMAGADAPAARGELIKTKLRACQDRIVSAYGDLQSHPVISSMERHAISVPAAHRAQASDAPVETLAQPTAGSGGAVRP